MQEFKRRHGDRSDGWLLRNVDPMFRLLPSLMRGRNESAVYFTYELDITETEQFMKEQRQTYPGLSYTHLFWAGIVRALAAYPQVNRFIAGRRVYARRFLRLSMTVKKIRNQAAKEYQIVEDFQPTDTLFEVAHKFDEKMTELDTSEDQGNTTDRLINAVTGGPRFFLGFLVRFVRGLDYWGLVPDALAKATPFFSSVYISNMGSLGQDAVHHHLYEFGTTSMFVSFGKKRIVREIGADGQPITRKRLTVKFVVDERICNGCYYAAALAAFKKVMEHPNMLLTPPVELGVDTEIRKAVNAGV